MLVAYATRCGSIDSGRVNELIASPAHSGPGETNTWSSEHAKLAHREYPISLESRQDHQPRHLDQRTAVTDTRLDDREVLKTSLSLNSNTGTIPDSRLLLEAYEEWGTDCVDHLLGAFAFAIWDAERERLFCARDHMGVKPLYYAHTDEHFAAASEPGPLFELPGITRTPSEKRIGDFLAGMYGDESETFYEDIARLPPGHYMTVTEDDLRVRRYWTLEDIEPFPQDANIDYEQRFRELFADAVRCRLRTPGQVGSFLSGGLDSSSIASMASEILRERGDPPLHTFSAVFEEITDCDERPYIDAVLDSGHFEPHFIHGDRVDPLTNLDTHLARRMAPYYPSLIMLILALYREIERQGVTVVLHGYGGDQTMGSDVRGYFQGLARRGRLPTLARELRGYGRRYPGLSTRGVLWRDVLRPLAPEPLRRLRHRLFDDDHYLDGTLASLDHSFARESGLLDRLRADAVRGAPRSQRALVRRSLTSGETTFNLELNHHAAAAHGVEPRYPYLDKRLVEFAVALPPGVNVQGGLDRTLVRNGLSSILPEAVRTRTDKMEFSPNVVHGTRTTALDRIESTLFEGDAAVAKYLDTDGLRASHDRLRTEGDVSAARDLLMATTLERWLRTQTA
ncbi:asparagine synthase-related protein [Halorientalis pallida]|uniref:asparagine synthase-related protein n=1 Tax=Halorientalis pallida TaxID=2479928 RepID=UPI003C6F413B